MKKPLSVQTMVKIRTEFPPNMARILSTFPSLPETVVFAYGDSIYNPHNMPLTEPLRIHELTHLAQQGNDPDGWWDNYIASSSFRLRQEVEAYSNEYNCYRTNQKDRNRSARYLHDCARRLSAGMYGSIISHSEAMKSIKQHADRGYTQGR